MVIRTLLIWLLALALPGQGVAAATMAFCGQAQAQAQARVHSRAVPAADVPHHAANGHEHHAGPDTPGQADHGDSHGCSACASCCSAGALLNAVPTVPAPEPAPTVFAAVVSSVDAPVADGLERPPRNALA